MNYNVSWIFNDTKHDISDSSDGESIDEDVENLLIKKKLAQFKKPNLAKFKKSNLAKATNLDFVKANSFKTDFLTTKAKKL